MTNVNEMSIDDALIHFGKKGMKWGQRKKYSRQEIKGARRNIRQAGKDIRAQKKVARKADGADKVLAKAKVKTMKASLMKNPDRVTAQRLTKGETVVVGLLAPGRLVSQALVVNLTARSVKKHSEK